MAAVVASLVLAGHLALGPLLAEPCEGLLEGGKAASFAVICMGQVRSWVGYNSAVYVFFGIFCLRRVSSAGHDIARLCRLLVQCVMH